MHLALLWYLRCQVARLKRVSSKLRLFAKDINTYSPDSLLHVGDPYLATLYLLAECRRLSASTAGTL